MATIIEQEILDKVKDRIVALNTSGLRYRIDDHFVYVEDDVMEEGSQPSMHRFFSVRYGDGLEIEAPSGIVSQAQLKRDMVVAVAYDVPGRSQEVAELYFAIDTLTIANQLESSCQPCTADDGELYAVWVTGARREFEGKNNSRMYVYVDLTIHYRRDL